MATRIETENQTPSIYNFPPFFTRQPTPSTWAAQAKFWQEIIIKEFRLANLFHLTPELLSREPGDASVAFFTNKKINRQLSQDTLEDILQFMENNGTASRLSNRSENRLTFIIWWRSKDEWAELVYQWVLDSGSHNKVYLIADLIDDDSHSDAVFFGMPQAVMRDILVTMEKSGRAKLVPGSGGSLNEAVKFAVV